MRLIKWEKLPVDLRIDEVKPYYMVLAKKPLQLMLKRLFDVIVSIVLLILLSPVFLIIAIWMKFDSPGSIFYRQIRVTQYGKTFKIFKFRTMMMDADSQGTAVTLSNDSRITKLGSKIRAKRIDELPQLINVLLGQMSFVGTRPEVPKYVEKYTAEMRATLLLPAGITSLASIRYKDESEMLKNADNADEVYINEILPKKMEYNLLYLNTFSFFKDLLLMIQTVL